MRAGAIAKRVVDELKKRGVDPVLGATNSSVAAAARRAFKGRNLSNYYKGGRGKGLSFQDLSKFALVTTNAPVLQTPNAGDHYAPARSLLDGEVTNHEDGMSPIALNGCGKPIDFSPLDFEKSGGNMALYNLAKGGIYPWDPNYYTSTPNVTSGFDPEYIMRHATDSANTAGSLATGEKVRSPCYFNQLYTVIP